MVALTWSDCKKAELSETWRNVQLMSGQGYFDLFSVIISSLLCWIQSESASPSCFPVYIWVRQIKYIAHSAAAYHIVVTQKIASRGVHIHRHVCLATRQLARTCNVADPFSEVRAV